MTSNTQKNQQTLVTTITKTSDNNDKQYQQTIPNIANNNKTIMSNYKQQQ